jgi:hypothetical protein
MPPDIILFYKIKYNKRYKGDKYKIINNNKSVFKLGKVEDNKFYEWISYNKFKQSSEKLPKLEQITMPSKLVDKYICGNNKNMTDEVQAIKNSEQYILVVGGYLISIIDKKVLFFKINKQKKFKNNIINHYFQHNLQLLQYNIKIKTYNPQQIFIKEYTTHSFINSVARWFAHSNTSSLPHSHSRAIASSLKDYTALLNISNNKYLYINFDVCEFISYDLITKFIVIPDKRITYAIDKLNNFYLFSRFDQEFTIMTNNNINMSPTKLYKLYNLKKVMFVNENNQTQSPFIENFQGIVKFYKKNIESSLELDIDGLGYSKLKKPISVLKIDGTKEILDKTKYIKLMKDYGNIVGIHKLKYNRPSWLLN